MNNMEKWEKLSEILNQMDVYIRTIGKMGFDQECCAPEDGMDQAGEDMAVLGKTLYAFSHSQEYQQLVCDLHENGEGLTVPQQALIRHLYEEYRKQKDLTEDFVYNRDLAQGKAYSAWLNAKKKNDFSLYRDAFEAVVDYAMQAVEARDTRIGSDYDEMLDDYEEGATGDMLDDFFARLKQRIVPLVQRIVKEGKPIREDFLTRACPIPQQEAFSRRILEMEGLRKSSLVLMTTEHPFTTNFGPNDVRVTTHYFEERFISNIFTTLHEGGHALFMMYEPEEFYGQHIANHMSNAMHECMSRFYENIIGRSEAFIHYIYPILKETSPDLMADVSERELYEGVNIVCPSLIRTEADELTYCLHIMVRYEIEKLLMNGKIKVDDVPALWNAKYKELLGVDVPDDARGCLQDVHWTSMFGYFPSYALGSAYGAQLLHAMQKDFDVWGEVEKGNLGKVLTWLKEKAFATSSIESPKDWMVTVTGESFNPTYYLDYLEEKFTKLYALQ